MKKIHTVVDFRPNQKEKKWYEQPCINLEINNVYKDSGRAVKDKDETIKKLCRDIVDHLNDEEPVILVCSDGMTHCGYIAMICRWWYFCEHGKVDKDFDYLKEVRDGNDFTSGKSKEQFEQMKAVKEYALGIMRWKSFVKK